MTAPRLTAAHAFAVAALACATVAGFVFADRVTSQSRTPPATRHAALRPLVLNQSLGGGDWYRLHMFHVPLARAQFEVVDVGMSHDLTPLVERYNASLVVNGGYFDTRLRPEGLVVSGGREIAPFTSRLGGGVLGVRRGVGVLHDADAFTPMEHPHEFAIQCKPRLIVDRAVNIRTDDGQRADRTALCLRNRGSELVIAVARSESVRGVDGPTLQAFARTLQRAGCEQALNLDGGPSTGAAWRQEDEVRSLSPRGGIRHAIVVRLPM